MGSVRGGEGNLPAYSEIDTTNIYAEVDLEMKAKALASVDITDLPGPSQRRQTIPSVMDFMRKL